MKPWDPYPAWGDEGQDIQEPNKIILYCETLDFSIFQMYNSDILFCININIILSFGFVIFFKLSQKEYEESNAGSPR